MSRVIHPGPAVETTAAGNVTLPVDNKGDIMKRRPLQIPVLVLTALMLAAPALPVAGHEIAPVSSWADLVRTWLWSPWTATKAAEKAGPQGTLPEIHGDGPRIGDLADPTASTVGPEESGGGESGHQIDPNG